MMDACEAWKNAVTDAKLAWYQHIAAQVESDGSINSPDWDVEIHWHHTHRQRQHVQMV